MPDKNCIVLQKVNKFYGDKQVLKDIDLQVPFGQIYGILGPSGSGKTTIVKIMAGILEASSGQTYVLNKLMPALGLMNKIGYMAQSDALYSLLTAAENLRFFGSLYGMSKSQLDRRIPEVMDLVKLSDDLDTQVQAYSGGMKRRLSLAIAILHSPPVLLLDEPTVGIDPLLRRDIWLELYKLAEHGVTIIVTTHVMDEADKCHSLAMTRDGRLIAKGSARQLQAEIGVNSIEEAFIYYGGGNNES
jgi:ABC-2 type transport system ATP-binding protein